MTERSSIHAGELLLSLALIAAGAFILYETRGIPDTTGAAQVGPRLFPYLIGIGLTACGAALGWQGISGGWRNMPSGQAQHDRPDWNAFALVSAGIVLHMILIGRAGFTVASTVLFALVARGFGSRKILRDVALGAALATAAFLVFTLALGLSLPKGFGTD
jgi:putative tricarboxylic transport membrane protein